MIIYHISQTTSSCSHLYKYAPLLWTEFNTHTAQRNKTTLQQHKRNAVIISLFIIITWITELLSWSIVLFSLAFPFLSCSNALSQPFFLFKGSLYASIWISWLFIQSKNGHMGNVQLLLITERNPSCKDWEKTRGSDLVEAAPRRIERCYLVMSENGVISLLLQNRHLFTTIFHWQLQGGLA